MTNRAYQRLVASKAKPSPIGKDLLWAFAVGGGICALGEALIQGYMMAGISRQDASTWATITLIFLSALLTGLNVFHRVAKYAGAGTLVPVTGFANSIAAPAIEFKSEGLITGLAVKMFTIAGPVLVYGIGSSVVYGILFWLFT